MAVPIRSPREIEAIAHAGAVARRVLDEAAQVCVPGASTAEIDEAAAAAMQREGATGVRGYVEREGQEPFAGHVCVNINEEAAHGVPGARRVRENDLVSIDVALCVDGWWADVARPVAASGARAQALRQAADEAMRAGLAAIRPGVRWAEVARSVRGALGEMNLVRGLDGHGVGRGLHEAPTLAYSDSAPDLVLRPGMVITLEPTVTDGEGTTVESPNGWTLLTADRGWACFRECTVAVERSGIRVLTGE